MEGYKMKKDLSPHSLSPFDQLEDTKNPLNCQSKAINYLQNLADKTAQDLNLLTSSYDEKNVTALAQCVIDFLCLSGYKAKLVSQSQRVRFYQMTLEDILPNDKTSVIWIPNPKLNGVHAEIVISLYGEKVIVEVTFDSKSQTNAENGRYHLQIRSFEEFLQWYCSTYGEGAL